MRLYNSLGRKLEKFESVQDKKVTMYSCGPTVYDYAHIGNFRSFLNSDLLRRFLEFKGYDVHHVMNITDVGHLTEDDFAEDKMIVASRRIKAGIKEAKKQGKTDFLSNPNDPYEIAAFYADAFINDAKLLNIKVADESETNMPRATNTIAGMQSMISKLLENGSAYVAEDKAVYFDVSTFKNYGELSGNSLDDLKSGAGGRVEDETQSIKKHPADFLLWKPDTKHIMKWDSPWGVGYPGWHIECSVMAKEALGCNVIDIHTGGEDLVFPHHECEIAQSCASSGEDRFANFWIHTRFLLVDGKKMSKSKGNFYTARDVLEGRATGSPVEADVLRFELLKTHYRQNANFTAKGITDSASNIKKIKDTVSRLQQEHAEIGDQSQINTIESKLTKDFESALDEDLNVSEAIASILGSLKNLKTSDDLKSLLRVVSVLGINTQGLASKEKTSSFPDNILSLVAKLNSARGSKDYNASDAIRDELVELGYEVRISAQGAEVKKK